MGNESNGVFGEYSVRFLELASDTENAGKPDRFDAVGTHTGQCGDTIRFYLRCENDRIVEIRFLIEGCIHTLACANAIVHLAAEKTVDQAWDITEKTVIDELEGIPKDHEHCAELAVGALYKTLNDLKQKEKKE